MAENAVDPAGTFLTERQVQVLVGRREGLTQAEIADRFGTSVANVSSIESAARRNVERARRTVDVARGIRATTRFRIPAGTHLRDVVERIYEAGDTSGVKVAYSDPELATYLHVHLGARLRNRRLSTEIEIGLTGDGEVLAPASLPETDRSDVA